MIANVLPDVVALVPNERNKMATKYLDEGNLEKCRVTLTEKAFFLRSNAANLPEHAVRLKKLAEINADQAGQIDGVKDNFAPAAISLRKANRAYQNQVDQQQRSVPKTISD